jgi:hypothetical protein
MVTALDLRSKLDAKVHQPHKSERRVPPGNKFAIPIGKRLNQNQRNTIALTVAKMVKGCDQARENDHETSDPGTSLFVRALEYVRTCVHKSKTS